VGGGGAKNRLKNLEKEGRGFYTPEMTQIKSSITTDNAIAHKHGM